MTSKVMSVLVLVCATAGLSVPSLAQESSPPGLDRAAVHTTRVPRLNSPLAATSHNSPQGPSKSSNPTTASGTPYTVGSVVDVTSTFPGAEEEAAVDPTNPNNLVGAISDFALRGGYNTTQYAVSFSGGAAGTWSEAYVPLLGGSPATSDGLIWEANSDPVVAIDRTGNVYLSNLYLNDSNNANGVYVSVGQLTAPNLGLSIETTYPVVPANTDPATTTLEDKEWIAVDIGGQSPYVGTVYVTWVRFVNGVSRILFSRSLDHGQTWSAPLQVSNPSQDGMAWGPQVAVGPNGEVYVVYEVNYGSGREQLFLVKSTDGGQGFHLPGASDSISPIFNDLSFDSTYRKNSFPALAVSPADGHVYVVYSDQPNLAVGAEVEFISSADGGATFSTPVALNNPAKGQQFFPAIAVDESGTIHVAWFDTRNNAKSAEWYDVYATYSTNGGVKFSTNARVTPSSIDAGTATFIGDYMGIAAAGGYAFPVWTTGGFNNGHLQFATLY